MRRENFLSHSAAAKKNSNKKKTTAQTTTGLAIKKIGEERNKGVRGESVSTPTAQEPAKPDMAKSCTRADTLARNRKSERGKEAVENKRLPKRRRSGGGKERARNNSVRDLNHPKALGKLST